MNKLILSILFAFLLLFSSLRAQRIEQDCLGAIPVCSTWVQVEIPSNDYGFKGENDHSCLGREVNSTWFRVRTGSEGSLCFSIIPEVPTDNYDWAIYDVSKNHCTELKDRPHLILACNASSSTGCQGETGANGKKECPDQQTECLPAFPQAEYIIRVQAPEGANGGFVLDLSNSSASLITPAEDPYIKADEPCYGESVLLQVNPYEGGDVNWYHDPTDIEPFYTGLNYYSIPLTRPYTYYLETTNRRGCRNDFFPVTLVPHEKVEARILASDTVLEYPSPILSLQLEGNIYADSYYWHLAKGVSSTLPNPVYTYEYPGHYKIWAKVTDINGCDHHFEQKILVRPLTELYVPSAFTPNGDGSNDFWSISSQLNRKFEIHIFDRMGREIFSSLQPDFKWDGTDQNGKILPVGNYSYQISYIDFLGNLAQKGGSIMLFR